MIKKLFSLFLLCCMLLPVAAADRAYKVEDIPMVHLQNRKRYVSNPDGILSPEAVSQMDQLLFNLEQTTGVQTLVAAVGQIEEGDCFDFAYELGRRNGVGQKGKDNGLVILLVTEARCIRFVTGYGLEGDLPDAVCKQIQERYMNKALAQGDWDKGMTEGVKAVCRQLEGTGEPPVQTKRPQEETDYTLLVAILVCCFLIVPLLLWFSIYQRKRCPRCHKYTLKQLSNRTVSQLGDVRTEEIVLRCSHCGHIKRTRRNRHHNDSHTHPGGSGAPFLGGPFFGGGFGGGHHSGGMDSGGSFDGGDFGGGGAGSDF